jgi:spermidine/putrescine transport system permease protein
MKRPGPGADRQASQELELRRSAPWLRFARLRQKRPLPAVAAAIYFFLHAPLAILIIFSFNDSRSAAWGGFSLRWYRAVFENQALIEATANSFLISAAATILATSAGTLCAYGLWKRRSPFLDAALSMSLVTPEIVMGVSLLALFQGIFRFLDVRLGMHTVVLAHVAFTLAFVVTVITARLRTMNATLEEAAMDLGATPWQAFLKVTLPQLKPAIVSAAMLAFTISFDDYVVTSLVAGIGSETLPMVIYGMARRGVSPAVNAVSTLIVIGVGVMIFAAERWRQE